MSQRIVALKQHPDHSGAVIMYVMSRDQRVRDNHALLAAQTEALERKLPLLVVFNVLTSAGFRRREHYEFMVAGLKEVATELDALKIHFVLTTGNMHEQIERLCTEYDTHSVYFDFSPLRGARNSQKSLAKRVSANVYIVDTHNIVPVWAISDKEEFAAHTLRRKVHKTIVAWCVEPDSPQPHPYQLVSTPSSLTWKAVDAIVASVPSCGIQHGLMPGEIAAHNKLATFMETGLTHYATDRNDATTDGQSDLSPYLHFGQISSLRVALELIKASSEPPLIFREPRMPSFEGIATKQDSIDAFLEELIVRKELADNFCFFQPSYDSLGGAKQWAQKSLAEHLHDPRDFLYTKAQFQRAETHDALWNAAQTQLTRSGKMHGYMRMYWAKKILEWSVSPHEAIEIAVYLNDTYSLDGGDPNGYVGILWSIAGVHDRAWFNRSVYGKIRYMTAGGISKKFDVNAYITHWS